MNGESQTPSTFKDVTIKAVKEKVAKSIKGQNPSWMNALSRKIVGSYPPKKITVPRKMVDLSKLNLTYIKLVVLTNF